MSRFSRSPNLPPLVYLVLFCGVFCLIGFIAAVVRALLPAIQIGVPLLLGWWLWQRYDQPRRRRQEALNDRFYRLLQQQHGYLTVLDFAMATRLSAVQARQYLDAQATALSAQFGVTESGDVFYIFPVRRSSDVMKHSAAKT